MIICYLPPIKGTRKLHWSKQWLALGFLNHQQISIDFYKNHPRVPIEESNSEEMKVSYRKVSHSRGYTLSLYRDTKKSLPSTGPRKSMNVDLQKGHVSKKQGLFSNHQSSVENVTFSGGGGDDFKYCS